MIKNYKLIWIGCYIFIVAMFMAIMGYFAVMCFKQQDTPDVSNFRPLPLGLLSITLWVILAVVSILFIRMLNQRFGGQKFEGTKNRIKIVLVLFSLSFLMRSIWDVAISFNEMNFNPGLMSLINFVFYFITEWLPIFFIYAMHASAFYKMHQISEKRKKRSQESHRSPETKKGKEKKPDRTVVN